MPVAPSPSRMKIAEKLETKSRLGTRTRRQFACSRSAAAIPVTAERYPGTSGSTQGERNETIPAARAVSTPGRAVGSLTSGILAEKYGHDLRLAPDAPVYGATYAELASGSPANGTVLKRGVNTDELMIS